MSEKWSRRRLLKNAAAISASLLLPIKRCLGGTNQAAREDYEIQIATVSAQTVRLTVLPIRNGKIERIPVDGSLVRESWGDPVAKLRAGAPDQTFQSGNLKVR